LIVDIYKPVFVGKYYSR